MFPPPRHAVVADLQRLRPLVQGTAGVTDIRACPFGSDPPAPVGVAFRIGQIANGVAHSFQHSDWGSQYPALYRSPETTRFRLQHEP